LHALCSIQNSEPGFTPKSKQQLKREKSKKKKLQKEGKKQEKELRKRLEKERKQQQRAAVRKVTSKIKLSCSCVPMCCPLRVGGALARELRTPFGIELHTIARLLSWVLTLCCWVCFFCL
jgi:hypothetical protein